MRTNKPAKHELVRREVMALLRFFALARPRIDELFESAETEDFRMYGLSKKWPLGYVVGVRALLGGFPDGTFEVIQFTRIGEHVYRFSPSWSDAFQIYENKR